MQKKKWRTPEVKRLAAGSAENLSATGSDGGTAPNNHATS
jgi:hypothetical protein